MAVSTETTGDAMAESATVAPADAATVVVSGDPKGRMIGLSRSAAARVQTLRDAEGDGALMLRLAVSGGGCSGFQYGFSFDSTTNGDDVVFSRDDVRLVVDDVSLDLLAGSEVDFVEDLIGASFQVRNPNASSSCGCGTSFAI